MRKKNYMRKKKTNNKDDRYETYLWEVSFTQTTQTLSGFKKVFSFVFWGSSSHIFGPRNDIFSEPQRVVSITQMEKLGILWVSYDISLWPKISLIMSGASPCFNWYIPIASTCKVQWLMVNAISLESNSSKLVLPSF